MSTPARSERRAGVPLRHPGPRAADRIVSVTTGVSVLRTALPRGANVAEALGRTARDAGCAGACVDLAHGSFAALRYVHPAEGTDRPAFYSDTIEPVGPCFVLGGSATVGTRDGADFAHVHATWLDEHGRVRGGHLLPETTVGDVPIEATVRLLTDAALVSDTDAETGMPAFAPYTRPDAGPNAGGSTEADAPVTSTGTAPRAVVSRVRPGEDLHAAVLAVTRAAGFTAATVRASLGSLVGARLGSGAGEVVEVDWPATELTSLTGTVRGGAAVLVASLVDRHGDVHSGVVRPGENPVAVTFELYVEEAGKAET